MTSVRILETSVLHASDVIYWLDGTTAEQTEDMLRVPKPLSIELSQAPRDLQLVHGFGKTGLLRRSGKRLVSGTAAPADKERPAAASYAIAGVVRDASGRFLPRAFSIDAVDGSGHALLVYPSPHGGAFGPSGGLLGCLRFESSDASAPWAILELEVATLNGPMKFRCQASSLGDFIMPLRRLAPLPEGIDGYAATLSVRALEAASADAPVDPDELQPMTLQPLADTAFSSSIELTIVPGEIRRIRSLDRDHVAVQPV